MLIFLDFTMYFFIIWSAHHFSGKSISIRRRGRENLVLSEELSWFIGLWQRMRLQDIEVSDLAYVMLILKTWKHNFKIFLILGRNFKQSRIILIGSVAKIVQTSYLKNHPQNQGRRKSRGHLKYYQKLKNSVSIVFKVCYLCLVTI